MRNRITWIAATAVLCLAGNCMFIDPGTGGGNPYPPLDRALAEITIDETAGGTAVIVAQIVDILGSPLTLQGGQAVAVNGTPLSGPDRDGRYSQTIAAAAEYTITVTEPTRGVETTRVSSPGTFTITAPVAGATVSLAGFTLSWSAADAQLDARSTIRQTLFGVERVERFEPAADAGTQTFAPGDLAKFQQGAPLTITLERTRRAAAVSGFAVGDVTITAAREVVVNPGP